MLDLKQPPKLRRSSAIQPLTSVNTPNIGSKTPQQLPEEMESSADVFVEEEPMDLENSDPVQKSEVLKQNENNEISFLAQTPNKHENSNFVDESFSESQKDNNKIDILYCKF